VVGDTGLEPVTSCMSSIPTDALWPQTWPRLRIGGVKTVTPQRIGLWPTNRGTVQRSPENLAAAQHRADHSCSPRTTGARPGNGADLRQARQAVQVPQSDGECELHDIRVSRRPLSEIFGRDREAQSRRLLGGGRVQASKPAHDVPELLCRQSGSRVLPGPALGVSSCVKRRVGA